MKKYIIIKADTNDADFVTEKNEITDKQIELIKPVIEAIKERNGIIEKGNWDDNYNWPTFDSNRLQGKRPSDLYLKSGKVTIEQFDTFSEFVPSLEGGIHTIEKIEILVVSEEIKLL